MTISFLFYLSFISITCYVYPCLNRALSLSRYLNLYLCVVVVIAQTGLHSGRRRSSLSVCRCRMSHLFGTKVSLFLFVDDATVDVYLLSIVIVLTLRKSKFPQSLSSPFIATKIIFLIKFICNF